MRKIIPVLVLALLVGCGRSVRTPPVAVIDIPTTLAAAATDFDEADYDGTWLRGGGLEAFVAHRPVPRLLVLRPAGGPSPLLVADHRYAGLRTAVLDPVQTKNWDKPTNVPAEIVEQSDAAVTIRGEIEPESRMQIENHFELRDGGLEVVHRVYNRGGAARELAAWSIASIPNDRGGVLEADVVVPLEPGDGRMRSLGFYGNTNAKSDAYELDGPTLRVHAGRERGGDGFKLAAWVPDGRWIYRDAGLTLASTGSADAAARYPEGGYNQTVYKGWNPDDPQWHYIELEHVGPLTRVEPGGFAELRQFLTFE